MVIQVAVNLSFEFARQDALRNVANLLGNATFLRIRFRIRSLALDSNQEGGVGGFRVCMAKYSRQRHRT